MYEANCRSQVALQYHDSSVLEQYHLEILFEILEKDDHNILCSLNSNDYRTTRKTIIECIIATDMSKHKPILAKFEDSIGTFHETEGELDQKDQIIVASVFTHICDLSGAGKTFSISSKWSQMVRTEFMAQVKFQLNFLGQ